MADNHNEEEYWHVHADGTVHCHAHPHKHAILKDHMDHCLVDAMRSGDSETLEELSKAIDLLMK